MKLKIFKIEKKFKKKEHQPDPDFYWKIVFFTTFVLVLVALIFGVRLLLQVSKEDFLGAVEYNRQEQKISKERIDKALEYFTNRENKSKTILNSPSPLIDPSL